MTDNSSIDDNRPFSQDLRDQLLEESIVILDQIIDDEVAQEVIQRMFYLGSEYPDKPIKLFVDSTGGGISQGYAIIDTIDSLSMPVHTHCYGFAAAMAAIIVAHGTKTHRSASLGAIFSIGRPLTDLSNTPTAEELQVFKLTRAEFSKSLKADTGRSVDEIEKICNESEFFNSFAALECNIVDQVIDCDPLSPPRYKTQ